MPTPYHWNIQFKDFKGRDVLIRIFESIGYTSVHPTIGVLTAADEPLTVTEETKEENDITSPIVYSSCKLRVIVDETEDCIAFMDKMESLKDGEYKILVQITDGSVNVNKFYGIITPDDIEKGISRQAQAIEIKAICPLTFSKSQKLTKTDGTKYFGRNKLSDYIESIITNAYLQFGAPITPNPTYSIVYNHGLTISNNTIYDASLFPYHSDAEFPSIFEQLTVNAAIFNDRDGRPISAHDVLERICISLKTRLTFYNGFFRFDEIMRLPSGYYEDIGVESGTSRLIGNREKIAKSRSFREAYFVFKYDYLYGLLKNSNLEDWTITPGFPDFIDFNFVLTPDYSSRKRGNGRVENPYGFMLRSYGIDIVIGGTPTGFHRMNYMEMIAFHSESKSITNGLDIEVSVQAYIEGPIGEMYIYLGSGQNSKNDLTIYTYMICDAVIYNEENPFASYRLTRDLGSSTKGWESECFWELIDLSSNSTFASGHYDFGLNVREGELLSNEGMATDPDLVMRYQFKHGNPIMFKSIRNAIQTASIRLPRTPGRGKLYIAVSQIMNPGRIISSKSILDCYDTVVCNVNVSATSAFKSDMESTGENVYLSRNIQPAEIKREGDIYMNTSSDGTVSGALYTYISYKDGVTGNIVEPGLVNKLNHYNYDEQLGESSLLKYNAFVAQSLNTRQQKISASVFNETITNSQVGRRFIGLYDPTRDQLTQIFTEYHCVNRNVYDVKSCISQITALSMKMDTRSISTTTLDDETDLLEEYNKQS